MEDTLQLIIKVKSGIAIGTLLAGKDLRIPNDKIVNKENECKERTWFFFQRFVLD
jgi:hypothetical protein